MKKLVIAIDGPVGSGKSTAARRVSASEFLILVVAVTLCLNGCNRVRNEGQMEKTISALRGAYSAFNRGDIEETVASLDPRIEWTEPAEFPGGGAYHGREEVKRYLTQSRAAWAEIDSEPERFIVAGDRIVVFVHARMRPKDSNQWQEASIADVYTVRNGKLVAMRAFADRQKALRWVGAEDSNP